MISTFVIFSTLLLVAKFQDSPCDQLSLLDSYDAIVVGSGPGGSVAARRMADLGYNILLVERGSAYSDCENCPIAANQVIAFNDPITGRLINTTVQSQLPGSPIYSFKDTAIQGGGTSINGMLHIRGDANIFFNSYWPHNWRWKHMKKFYAKYENYNFPEGFYGMDPFNYRENYRGKNGPVKVTQKGADAGNGYVARYLDAVKTVFPNIINNNHFFINGSLNNGRKPGIGTSPTETTSFNGIRSSAFSSYLQPTPSNLKSITGVRVNRVLFSGKNVTGVELVFWNISTGKAQSSSCTVNAPVVVSSAGAIGTPKLLKLSGVGPSAELTALGINVVSDLDGVGSNLCDHYGINVITASFNASNPLPFSNDVANMYGQLFYNVDDEPHIEPDFDINQPTILASPTLVLAIFSVNRVNGIFRGTVTLQSSNPDDDPIVNPNFLSSEIDKQVLARALNKTLQIVQKLGLVLISDPCSTASCNDDLQTLDAYISAGLGAVGYHSSGTAAIKQVTKKKSLAVKGTRGLYVLDASIFPLTPASNPQSTLYAVSEKGIKLIIRDIERKNLL